VSDAHPPKSGPVPAPVFPFPDPADRPVSGIFEGYSGNSPRSAPELQTKKFQTEKTGLFKPVWFEDNPKNGLHMPYGLLQKITQ